MNVQEFLSVIKKSKYSRQLTGGYTRHKGIKVTTSNDDKTKTIYSEDKCNCCNKLKSEQKVIVVFKKPVKLTIFEAGLLFMVFIENKRPFDYGNYHECVAGKEFIDNIKSYRVVEI